MGKYEGEIKRSITWRMKQKGMNREKAFHDLKTKLYLAELVWEKEIEEIVEGAKIEQTELTDEEKAEISRKENGLSCDRTKRLEAEEIERSEWAP